MLLLDLDSPPPAACYIKRVMRLRKSVAIFVVLADRGDGGEGMEPIQMTTINMLSSLLFFSPWHLLLTSELS